MEIGQDETFLQHLVMNPKIKLFLAVFLFIFMLLVIFKRSVEMHAHSSVTGEWDKKVYKC